MRRWRSPARRAGLRAEGSDPRSWARPSVRSWARSSRSWARSFPRPWRRSLEPRSSRSGERWSRASQRRARSMARPSRSGSARSWVSHRWTWGGFQWREIHPLVTFRPYRPVNGSLPAQGVFASILQVAVALAFPADGRGGAVAWQDRQVVAEWQQLRLDAGDELLGVSIGEVGTADRVLEQRVADQREARGHVDEHQVSGRVTGDVQHVECQIADADRLAFDQPAIGFDVARVRDAEARTLSLEAREQEGVALVGSLDRDGERLGKFGRAARMIEVAVRQKNSFRGDLELIDRAADVRDVAARIDDGCAVGGGAGDDRAILLDRRDRHDGDLEGLHEWLQVRKTERLI